MAETYKKIYPGNWVVGLNAWPKPNADFVKNNRPVGDPHDRQQQAVLYMPGVLAVQKVGFVHVQGAVPAAPGVGAGVQGYDITIGSPDTRGDDKPRADVKGLIVPAGASLYRVGLRVPRRPTSPVPSAPAPRIPWPPRPLVCWPTPAPSCGWKPRPPHPPAPPAIPVPSAPPAPTPVR